MIINSPFSELYDKVLEKDFKRSRFLNLLLSTLETTEDFRTQKQCLSYLSRISLHKNDLDFFKILENHAVSNEQRLIRLKAIKILIYNKARCTRGLLDWVIKNEPSEYVLLRLERILRTNKKGALESQYNEILNTFSRKFNIIPSEIPFYLDLHSQSTDLEVNKKYEVKIEEKLRTNIIKEFKNGSKRYAIRDGFTIGLDLTDFGLISLPASIKTLRKLEILILKKNLIRSLPNSIKHLKELTTLDLSQNKITILNDIFYDNKKLTNLSLSRNYKIEEIPQSLKIHVNKLIKKRYVKIGLDPKEAYVIGLFQLLTGRVIEGREFQNGRASLKSRYSMKFETNEGGKVIGLYLCNPHFFRIPFIPEDLGDLNFLEVLHLPENDIKSVPKSIKNLSKLRKIDLKLNKIQKFPLSITSIRKIEYIDFSFNFIDRLPEEIEKLHNLKSLSLKHNQIEKIPKTLQNLNKLKFLDLSYNNIKTTFESIGNFENLTYLNLSHNKIEEIPNNIKKLKSLKKLDLSYNHIKYIPEALSKLDSLEQLDLNCNPLSKKLEINKSIKNIKHIDLRINSFEQFAKSKVK